MDQWPYNLKSYCQHLLTDFKTAKLLHWESFMYREKFYQTLKYIEFCFLIIDSIKDLVIVPVYWCVVGKIILYVTTSINYHPLLSVGNFVIYTSPCLHIAVIVLVSCLTVPTQMVWKTKNLHLRHLVLLSFCQPWFSC